MNGASNMDMADAQNIIAAARAYREGAERLAKQLRHWEFTQWRLAERETWELREIDMYVSHSLADLDLAEADAKRIERALHSVLVAAEPRVGAVLLMSAGFRPCAYRGAPYEVFGRECLALECRDADTEARARALMPHPAHLVDLHPVRLLYWPELPPPDGTVTT